MQVSSMLALEAMELVPLAFPEQHMVPSPPAAQALSAPMGVTRVPVAHVVAASQWFALPGQKESSAGAARSAQAAYAGFELFTQ